MRYERGSRVRSSIPVRVASGEGQHDGTLTDFSRKGARLRGVPGLAKDDAVSIEIPHVDATIAATVAWIADDEAGLTFAAELADSVARKLLEPTGKPVV